VSDIDDHTAIRLRPALPEDRFRMRRWLADPEVQAWWGSAASAEAEITLAMSSEASLCRIIEMAGVPIGYGHAVEVGLWGGPHPDDVPAGTWDIDLFIAAADHRRRGAGGAALALLVADVFATRLAVACCAVVSVRNEAAARTYEKAGFRWARIWQDPIDGPCWLMLRERPGPQAR
jgi:RimJ/RimL family protein N-acetyltransferase